MLLTKRKSAVTWPQLSSWRPLVMIKSAIYHRNDYDLSRENGVKFGYESMHCDAFVWLVHEYFRLRLGQVDIDRGNVTSRRQKKYSNVCSSMLIVKSNIWAFGISVKFLILSQLDFHVIGWMMWNGGPISHHVDQFLVILIRIQLSFNLGRDADC